MVPSSLLGWGIVRPTLEVRMIAISLAVCSVTFVGFGFALLATS